jgi:L-lactate dehydrogenase complex protein LldG
MSPDANAQATILQRIRAANRAEANLAEAVAAWENISRLYRRTSSRSPALVKELFIERLRDYDAQVETSPADAVPAAIERILAAHGNPRILLPSGMPEALLPSYPNFAVDESFSHAELDQFEGVITLATLAIAETGTLVLQSVPGQGRRAVSLVPNFHLCILRADQIVETVPEAMQGLAATSSLPTTFVSGPSATSDIEMTRIKGVHGPRVLHVIVVD